MNDPLLYLGFAAAMAMGITLGLLGGGGSILAVPILVYLFRIPGTVATFYSLFIVGVSAGWGAVSYRKRGLVAFKTAWIFFLPSLLGVILARRVLLPLIPDSIGIASLQLPKDTLLVISFSLVMIFAALSMIRTKTETSSTDPSALRTLTGGFSVGALSGFVGAGGGFLIVPALNRGLQLPISIATGTSLMIIALNSLSGFCVDWWGGSSVDWSTLLPLLFFSLIGVYLGSKLNRHLPAKILKLSFGWFVLSIGIAIAARESISLILSGH